MKPAPGHLSNVLAGILHLIDPSRRPLRVPTIRSPERQRKRTKRDSGEQGTVAVSEEMVPKQERQQSPSVPKG